MKASSKQLKVILGEAVLFMAVGRQSLASEVIMSPKQEKLQNVRLAHLRKDKGEPKIKATWRKKGKTLRR